MLNTTLPARARETRHWFHGSDLESRVAAYVQHLTARGYAVRSIGMYLESLAHLAFWMRRRRIRLIEVNERIVWRFIDRHLPTCRCARRCQRSEHTVRAALVQLLTMLRVEGYIPPAVSDEPEHIAAELREFMRFLVDVRGVAAPTEQQRLFHIRAFLRHCFPKEPIRLASLKPAGVADFVLRYAAHWTPSSKKALSNSLRSFFRFRALAGRTDRSSRRRDPADRPVAHGQSTEVAIGRGTVAASRRLRPWHPDGTARLCDRSVFC